MPVVFNFDPVTKAYSHKNEARESPREPGVFLLPANATWAAVPDYKPGQAAVWQGREWQVIDLPDRPEGLVSKPPEDLAPGIPPVFPENPKDGDIAWSARENGDIVKWTYQGGQQKTWTEELTGETTGTRVPFSMDDYATKSYVHEYVEQRLADALKAVASKVEDLKQADSA